jgi:hypothetical protein
LLSAGQGVALGDLLRVPGVPIVEHTLLFRPERRTDKAHCERLDQPEIPGGKMPIDILK